MGSSNHPTSPDRESADARKKVIRELNDGLLAIAATAEAIDYQADGALDSEHVQGMGALLKREADRLWLVVGSLTSGEEVVNDLLAGDETTFACAKARNGLKFLRMRKPSPARTRRACVARLASSRPR